MNIPVSLSIYVIMWKMGGIFFICLGGFLIFLAIISSFNLDPVRFRHRWDARNQEFWSQRGNLIVGSLTGLFFSRCGQALINIAGIAILQERFSLT